MEEASEKGTGATISLKVKTLTNEVYELTAAPEMRVIEFKKLIQDAARIPIAKQRLLYKGKLLNDGETLQSYHVSDGQVLQVIASTHQPSIASSRSSQVNRSEAQRIEQFRRRNNFYQRHRYLQRRMNGFRINQPESLEVLEQSQYTIDQLIGSLSKVRGEEVPIEPFCFRNRKYEVGTWVDIRDSMDQWYEGQIIDIHNDYVLVHYNSWNDHYNEWIEASSPRLLPFRSNTVQPTHSLYMSPFPLNPPALAKLGNAEVQRTIPEFLKSFERTLGEVSQLLKECQQPLQSQFDDNNTYRQQVDFVPPVLADNDPHEDMVVPSDETAEKLQKQMEEICMQAKDDESHKQVETPVKQLHQISLNDNLSNKCDDNVSNKCDNDDISNKSYKSKRSEGLVDTSSMKSLKIQDKPTVFFDLQAKSVRSQKSDIRRQNAPIRQPFQQNILEQEESQMLDQESCYDIHKSTHKLKAGGSQKKLQVDSSVRQKEVERRMKISQLAPLLDRMGRLMIDLAPHVALMGDTNQIPSQQNLSVATNEGSLQSRIISYLRSQRPATEPVVEASSPSIGHQYCDFQIPIMLTPIEIYALNEIQSGTNNPDN